ncbi:MAG TPA: CD225/dispanin family protein [Pyrinomonadaceae bacterium]|jgi:hypothetical protein
MVTQSGAQGGSSVERPPNYLVRAIILSLLLVPMGLLIAASKLVETLTVLFGPSYRSEIPAGMTALMSVLAGVAALMGVFMPVAALIKSFQVNSKFGAGDYAGAETASKRSLYYSRQSIIFLVVLAVIMFTDIFRYVTANR